MNENPRNLPITQYRRFESNREYEALMDDMLQTALRIVRVFDRSLGRNYNSSGRIELLQRFLLGGRGNRLLIILHDASRLGTEQPRLLELARQFSHAVVIRETLRGAKHVYDPFIVFDGSHYLHRFHYDHMRAAQGLHDPAAAQKLIERFDEIAGCSGPPVAAHVTGL